MTKFSKIFSFMLCSLLGFYLSAQSAAANIDQNRAKQICDISSTNKKAVISAVRKANAERDWTKIIGCGALAVSLGDNAADEEATKGFLTFYTNADNAAKIFLIDFLRSAAVSASLLRNSHSLGMYFALFFQEDFELLDASSQKDYSETLFALATIWEQQKPTASFSHYVLGQAYLRGQFVEQNFDVAMTQFKKSIEAHNSLSISANSMSRAKYCWLSVPSGRAESNTEQKRGVAECLSVLNGRSTDVGALEIAVASLAVASTVGGVKPEERFWKSIYEYIDKPNMTATNANNYLSKRCRSTRFCDVDHMSSVLEDSSAVFETSFIASSLLNRVKIQASLKKAGYYSGQIDGLWGRLTQEAVKKFANATDSPLFRVKDLTAKLLNLYPVSENSINASVARIYEKIKGKRVSNYVPSYPSYQADTSHRIFRRKSILPKPWEDGYFPKIENSFTSISYKGIWINCHTGAGITLCN